MILNAQKARLFPTDLRVRSRIVAVLALCCALEATAQMTGEETVSRMKTAEGLEVSLFAAEPELHNPTCMDIDADGRIWVVEAVNYRLFNQPMSEPAGDRIRVLEDTDGDGRCDKATTYFQDPMIQAPMGIAVLGDRVYICQSPDLFYLEDTNGDGVADKKTVILTGFQGIDNDHAIHGVMFGPDGHLYMSNGDRGLDVTDKSGNRVHVGKDAPYMAGSVLRTDLEGKRLELLAHGMRNPYEPTVDSFGTVYISDNDDDGNQQCRINYVMEGASYGYWPKRKGDKHLDEVHWNEDLPGVTPKMIKTGFGSPCGLLYYEGDALPERLHGTLIHADAGPAVVRAYHVTPSGAGYTAEMEILLSCEEDKWFRPVDVTAAPDGSIYVADWYDPGVGGHRMQDVLQGRIFHLTTKGAKPSASPLDLSTDDGIVAAFSSPNQARRYLAYKAIEERIANGNPDLAVRLYSRDNPTLRARALWLLSRDATKGKAAVLDASKSPDARVRTQAVRILASMGVEHLRDLKHLAKDPDPAVRRQLMLELGAVRNEDWARAWLLDLAGQYDGKDRFYREAMGLALKGRESWAYTELAKRVGEVWDERTASWAIQFHPPEALRLAQIVAEDGGMSVPLRKLALKALDAIGSEQAGKIIVARISESTQKEVLDYALHLLSRNGGDAWRPVLDEPAVDVFLNKAMADEAMRPVAWTFIADTRLTAYISNLLAAAQTASLPAADRTKALEIVRNLIPQDAPDHAPTTLDSLKALASDADAAIQVQALNAVKALNVDAANEFLKTVLMDAGRPKDVRKETVRLLGGAKSGSNLMLHMVEAKELPVDLTIDVRETLYTSPFEDVRLMAEQLLPRELTVDGQALPPIKDLVAMAGESERGRAIFFDMEKAQCSRCHKVKDQGRDVGPDLSKIGEKYGKDGLLESILNPSAAVAHEYQVWIVRTETEGYLSGYIRTESPEGTEIMDSAGNVTKVATDEIIDRRLSMTSLMPTGLTTGLTTQEFVDLVAFLSTLK